MFNEGGEIAIFEKIGANAVFYGQVSAWKPEAKAYVYDNLF